MRGRSGLLAVVYAFLQLEIAGCFSGDHDRFMTAQHRRSEWPFLERTLDLGAGEGHRGPFHSLSHARISKLRPAAIVGSHFRQAPRGHGISLLARTDHEVQVENAPVSAQHTVTVERVWVRTGIDVPVPENAPPLPTSLRGSARPRSGEEGVINEDANGRLDPGQQPRHAIADRLKY
ncbi:hypothetical protein AAFF_G00083510 [Aldrovandia affinis]|uniref:Secreted protein n=1 Tax=Aldrovandia affinis TaxID=143900 RepID=A0AAD7RX56_9TELE|nr:hypothetical protein AAFF_G00083510 [Aldrovandia affinis]